MSGGNSSESGGRTSMPVKGLLKFNKMYSAERKEHPTLPTWAVKQIVKDHLKK